MRRLSEMVWLGAGLFFLQACGGPTPSEKEIPCDEDPYCIEAEACFADDPECYPHETGGNAGAGGEGGSNTGGNAGSETGGAPETGGTSGAPSGGTSGSAGASAGSAGEMSGGTSGAPSGGASGNGGVPTGGTETGGSGGTPTGGNSGDGGSGGSGGTETGGSGGTGGDPCDEVATPQWLAEVLSGNCNSLFGASACSLNNGLSRGNFMTLLLSTVSANQFQGYEEPTAPHFSDVPVTHAVERAYWLGLLEGEGALFFPDNPAGVCWADPVAGGVTNLPTVYAVVREAQGDNNFSPGSTNILSHTYSVFGTSATNPLDFELVVNNNLQANFDVAQTTSAIESAVIECNLPEALSAEGTMTGGQASVSMPGCYAAEGAELVLTLRFNASVSAVSGQEIRIGLSSFSLPVRGDGHESVPTWVVL